VSLAVALCAAGACDQALKIRNVAPRVTAVSEVTPAAAGLRVLFWVQDHEEEPVDVAAAWSPAAGCDALRARVADRGQASPDPQDPGSLAGFDLRPVAQVPGQGHRLIGLTSGAAWPGLPHELAWDTAEVDAAEVCLYLLPDDRNGSRGEPTVSPTFALAVGFGGGGAPAPPDAAGAAD
jgi:hypothetical protein